MVGGYDFDRSKFNRATQASRQLGSLFKAALYGAAIDQGYTTTTIVQDEPVSYDVGPGQNRYAPTNYDNTYEGPITLRRALEKSRNVPAVWVMNELGPEIVVDFAPPARVQLADPAVPLRGPRVRGSHVAGSHQRVLRLPEPGDPDGALRDRAHRGPRRRGARG